MNLITCSKLRMGYEGKVVIDNINFSVKQGDYLCIIGENGAGKSTLLKGILGLVNPLFGKIKFLGLKQTQIGYLPQQTQIQKDFPATAYEVVLSGCLNSRGLKPFYTKAEKERANQNIKKLNIDNLRSRSYRELSGGQQQRVLLARALCATHKLLLLDEPVAGLDPIVTADMYSLINTLNKKDGITVIMISHDIKSAVEYGDKILHVNKKTGFFGTCEDYKKTDMYKDMIGGRIND